MTYISKLTNESEEEKNTFDPFWTNHGEAKRTAGKPFGLLASRRLLM